jgi:hypothetical protein
MGHDGLKLYTAWANWRSHTHTHTHKPQQTKLCLNKQIKILNRGLSVMINNLIMKEKSEPNIILWRKLPYCFLSSLSKVPTEQVGALWILLSVTKKTPEMWPLSLQKDEEQTRSKCQWLTPVIPATWEAEIRRIEVQG